MRLLWLEIEGFRSYVQKSRLEFPDNSGLYLVQGRNLVNPQLEGNATGKSGFCDAICWCFYGFTARGQGSGNVESWSGAKTCQVTLCFEHKGQKHLLERGRRPIRLLLNGEMVEQGIVNDLLGLTYEQFLNVMLMGQFGTLFPDMKPAERLALVSQVQGLDMWTAAADRANDRLKQLTAERDSQERVLHGLRSRLASLGDAAARSRALASTWDAEHAQRVDAAQGALDAFLERQDDSGSALQKAEARYQGLQDQAQAGEVSLGKLEKDRYALRTDRAAQKATADQLVRQIQDLEKQIRAMKDLDGASCPTCKQAVGAKHVQASVAVLNKSIGVLDESLETVDAKTRELDASIKELTASVESVEQKRRQALSEASTVAAEVSRLRSKQAQQRALRERLEADVSRLAAEKNPHTGSVAASARDQEAVERDAEDVQVQLWDTQTALDLLGDCPKLFRELRLWLVDQALDELTIHANSSLVELGLKGWKILFSVERETKSGGIARGFEVLIQSPSSPERVPWESWSGGETQRLRIACAVGLANLIRDRIPSPPLLEFWDEPTAHLNPGGVNDLVDFFSARGDDRQVWLIDHRALDAGVFDGTVTVTFDDAGSHITR